jgi:hypothetical protein
MAGREVALLRVGAFGVVPLDNLALARFEVGAFPPLGGVAQSRVTVEYLRGNRYMDPRGAIMWDRVMNLIGEQRGEPAA